MVTSTVEVLSEIKQDIRLFEHRVLDLKRQGDGWVGLCPLHNDTNPSLRIDQRGGSLVFYCHPCEVGGTVIDLEMHLHGCDEKTAIANLKKEHATGTFTPLPPVPKKPAKEFLGTEEQVNEYAEALEVEYLFGTVGDFLLDSKLSVVQEELKLGYRKHYFGCGNHCKNCKESEALAIPLYWSGELVGLKYRNLQAPDKDHKWTQERGSKSDFLWMADMPPADSESKVVGVFEGVRDIALARALGFNSVGYLATSNVPERNPSERFNESVMRIKEAYRHALLIGDNDEAGEEAKQRLKKIIGPGASFATIPEPYKDLSEFYEKNGEAATKRWLRKVYSVAAETQPFGAPTKPDLHSAPSFLTEQISNIEAKKMNWLWSSRIPKGKLAIFAGNPDTGKTTVACDVIARITTGKDWPDAKNEEGPANVLLLSAEDDPADTLRPRLEAAGADLKRVHIVKAVSIPDKKAGYKQRAVALDNDLGLLEKKIQQIGNIGLVVIDPLTSYLGKTDLNKETELRRALVPIRDLCERTGVTVLALTHFNKRADVGALHRVGGAVAMTGVARAAWLFMRDPETEEDEFLMVLAKNNLTKRRTGLRYTIEERLLRTGGVPVIEWKGEHKGSADSVLETSQNPFEKKRAKANRFLEERLRNGPKPSEELLREANDFGVGRTTLFNMKKELGIAAEKRGDVWVWAYPAASRVQKSEN